MTTFKIGQTVQRLENHRECRPIEIINDYTLKYVIDLVERGYPFKVVKDVEEEFDFELPAVPSSPSSAPRVHVGGSVCLGCEG